MGDVLIVSGPPGAGKSTVAEVLAQQRDPSVLVTGDEFFHVLRRGRIDPWLAEAHEQNVVVFDAAVTATARLAAGPYWTVYDGVVLPWSLAAFGTAGIARLHYAVLLPDVEECVRRVIARDRHEFRDETAARHMHAQFADADIPERHLLRADAGAEHLADRIMILVEDGTLLVAD